MSTAYDLITKFNSPNFTPASRVRAVYGMDRKITAITIHHWGIKGQKFQNIVNYLCRKGGNTSAHEVIESGKVAVIRVRSRAPFDGSAVNSTPETSPSIMTWTRPSERSMTAGPLPL